MRLADSLPSSGIGSVKRQPVNGLEQLTLP